MPLIALLAVSGYLHMADARDAAGRYARGELALLESSGYAVGECRHIRDKTGRCTITFRAVGGDASAELDENVIVRLSGRRILVRSLLFD